MDKQKLLKVLDEVSLLIEKCGGEGGSPGPCPAGQNPAGGSGAPADKPGKPAKKPPKKPAAGGAKPDKLDAHHMKPLDYTKPPDKAGLPKGRSAWEKVVNIGFTLLKQAGAKLDAKITEVKAKLDDELKISAMGKEIKGKVDGFVAKVLKARSAIDKSVKGIHKRVHSALDKMESKLQKAAAPAAPESDTTESELHLDMQILKQHLTMVQVLEDSMDTISGIIDHTGQPAKEDE